MAGYRIEPFDGQFTVFGPHGEDVAVHSTWEEAEEEIKRRLEEDERFEMAKILVHTATKSYMHMYGVDRGTARDTCSPSRLNSSQSKTAAKWISSLSLGPTFSCGAQSNYHGLWISRPFGHTTQGG
jgi:hypothetical protein